MGAPVREVTSNNAGGAAAIADGRLRIEHEDGTVELRARRARHLMIHVFSTLRDDERELFTDQVLSSVTRDEFIERGLDPRLAFDALKQDFSEIAKLFRRVPQGELTPGALWKKVGERTYRLKIQGARARGLKWNAMDARFEGGAWRLRWFAYDS